MEIYDVPLSTVGAGRRASHRAGHRTLVDINIAVALEQRKKMNIQYMDGFLSHAGDLDVTDG